MPYRPHPRRIDEDPIRVPNRAVHGAALKASLKDAVRESAVRRSSAAAHLTSQTVTPGIYVQFESAPNTDLRVESLEDRRGKTHIEVVAFTEEERTLDGVVTKVQRATVFVPDGLVKKFIDKFDRYEKTPPAGAPVPEGKRVQRHHDAFDRVAALRLATLKALWTDAPQLFPADGAEVWWEVWLRRAPDRGEVERFRSFSEQAQVVVSDRTLVFDDRTIVLAKGTVQAVAMSLDVLDSIAELRSARPLAAGVRKLTNFEQGEYIEDVVARMERRTGERPAVCVLDTGTNRGHPLLSGDLHPDDVHSVDEENWGTDDHDGHGTEMAGLALLGNLTPLILGNGPVEVAHCLESVKILPPPPGENAPEVYGAITAEAVSLPEIQAPARKRVFSMALTAPDETDRGRPTSWSSAVDALAAGRSYDQDNGGELTYLDDEPRPRLLVVSAGNVRPPVADHLVRSDVEPVEDPGQAWNALTVGAHTELALLVENDWPGGQALAPAGELSPWSRTSLTFERKWPLKPDVVFEGANVVRTAAGEVDFPAPSLSVLTTGHDLQARLLELTWGTSAATAEVARLGARIGAEYPSLWPESIRALIVHSAEWTPRMLQSVPPRRKSDVRRLVRRYGFGVPQEERALRSAGDALTLVHQGTIRPFANGKLNEMHVHSLPWPKVALAALGAANVLLRVTLSYFIEPNPSRRGHTSRYRYASHGLRFDLQRATEKPEAFRKRINMKDLGDGEAKPDTSGDLAEWMLGEQRYLGSIHSDFWEGSAADLAERGVIGVYPVSGWWKDLPKRDRSARGARYSMVISIETDTTTADLWTPVAQEVGIAVGVTV